MSKMNFNVEDNKEQTDTDKDINQEENNYDYEYAQENDYEDEFVLEDDDSNDDLNDSTSHSEEGKAQLIKKMIVVIIIIFIVILLLLLISKIIGRKRSYEEIETIMVNAAESYFEDHPDNLPKKDGGKQIVDVSVLVAEKKMKPLSKYTDAICTGSVKVQKVGTNYSYIPRLDCGDSYSTDELYKIVRQNNKIVSSGYGLYNKDGNYVFRGETVNNYVQLDSALWRIVKINSSNNLVLVMDEPLGTLVPWDDRFNKELGYNAGINNYSTSRIKEKLEELYNTSSEDIEVILLSDKDKTRIVSHNTCTGKRGLTEAGAEQAVECKEVTRGQMISVLSAADYMNASVDASCTNPSSQSCQNYNYLITDKSWWLSTAVANSSAEVYMVSANSGIDTKKAMMYARIRPVVYLNSDVMSKGGSGTKEDPYIVK